MPKKRTTIGMTLTYIETSLEVESPVDLPNLRESARHQVEGLKKLLAERNLLDEEFEFEMPENPGKSKEQ